MPFLGRARLPAGHVTALGEVTKVTAKWLNWLTKHNTRHLCYNRFRWSGMAQKGREISS